MNRNLKSLCRLIAALVLGAVAINAQIAFAQLQNAPIHSYDDDFVLPQYELISSPGPEKVLDTRMRDGSLNISINMAILRSTDVIDLTFRVDDVSGTYLVNVFLNPKNRVAVFDYSDGSSSFMEIKVLDQPFPNTFRIFDGQSLADPSQSKNLRPPVWSADELLRQLDMLHLATEEGTRSVADSTALVELFQSFVSPKARHLRNDYPGILFANPDETRIGLRDSNVPGNESLDVRMPNGDNHKVIIQPEEESRADEFSEANPFDIDRDEP